MKLITWLSKNKGFVVASLGLIVGFSGLILQLTPYISPFFFRKPPDYKIVSFDIPQTLDLNLPLGVSPKYYVITLVDFESQATYSGGKVKLSINFENKGKTDVQQPRLILYFVDSLQQVRAIWNQSLTTKEFIEGLVLEYILPSADQKVMGSWNLIALLYDYGNRELISYAVQEFIVTETRTIAPTGISAVLSAIAAISAIAAVILLFRKLRV